MSVLIRGIKRPTSEEKCKFFQPAPFRAPFCVINGVCHGIDDCPFIEVPPHGRLIDADALLNRTDLGVYDLSELKEILDHAPTVIESDVVE